MSSNKVLYSAIVLTGESQKKLVNLFSDIIPEGWEVFAHHMTFAFKQPLPDDLKEKEGETIEIRATHMAKGEKVMAVKVDGEYTDRTTNETPHITLAVNKKEGGTPVMSNELDDWSEIDPPIELEGTIEEITK